MTYIQKLERWKRTELVMAEGLTKLMKLARLESKTNSKR